MKKFRIAALLMCFVAMSMAFTSCQKAEDLIIGKWKVTGMTGSNISVGGITEGAILEFTADNKLNLSYGDASALAGTYSVEGETLTYTLVGVSITCSIDKISSTDLTLSFNDGEGVMTLQKV